MEGYDLCHKNRVARHGAGVAFFIKSIINYTIIEQLTADVENVPECITVKLLFKTQIIVSCLYRKPSSKIADFMECIESMLSSIKGAIYICGDFNIDLLSYNVNNNKKKNFDKMFSMSLFPLINKPTHITNQCHSIIDSIYTNSINEDITSGVIIADISDHFPIFSILQRDIHKKETEQFFNLRANSEENICQLNCLLDLECWHHHNLPTSITIGNAQISFKQSVKNLGFILDCHLTMNAHVSNIARTCYFELRRLAFIRRILTNTATATLVSAFVLSRIDYCNSLLFGSTHDVTSHLQRIQNYAARVILRLPMSSSITIHLKSLHWLPVKVRSTYKIACLCYHCHNSTAPSYVTDMLHKKPLHTRNTRSSSYTMPLLNRPAHSKATLGDR